MTEKSVSYKNTNCNRINHLIVKSFVVVEPSLLLNLTFLTYFGEGCKNNANVTSEIMDASVQYSLSNSAIVGSKMNCKIVCAHQVMISRVVY